MPLANDVCVCVREKTVCLKVFLRQVILPA